MLNKIKKKLRGGESNSKQQAYGRTAQRLAQRKEANANIMLLATMPRSATWMTHFFFEAFEKHLNASQVDDDKLDLLSFYDKSGLTLYRAHVVLPGFNACYNGSFRDRWDNLEFWYQDHYDHGRDFCSDFSEYFDPFENHDLKVVYVYRNLFDQAISAYRHIVNHKIQIVRDIARACEDVNDYIVKHGCDGYLKQFTSYHYSREFLSNQLHLLKYEELICAPRESFHDILQFGGVSLESDERQAAFESALNFISMESMKALEKKIGRAFGDDQLSGMNESHMRSGKSGSWRDVITKKTYDIAAERFESMGLDLKDNIGN